MIAARVKEVSVLPQVVFKVIELTGSQAASAVEIERAVSIDPGFSARILRLVNSAFYALPKQVGSVKDAVMFIGFSTLRQIAMTIGVFDMFMGKTDKGSMRRRLWWRHSLDTSAVCRALAKNCFPALNPDEAHAAGLLHDIGKTILDRYGGKDYDEVDRRVAAGMNRIGAERDVYETDHCCVGFAVTTQWRFPNFLIEAAGHHHAPALDIDNPELCALVAASSVFANMIAHKSEMAPRDALPDWVAMALSLDEDGSQAAFVQACTAIEQASGLAVILK